MYLFEHGFAWLSLISGAAYLIATAQMLVRDKRVTSLGLVFCLSAGVALTGLGLLGLVGFLSSMMVRASWFTVIGMAIIVDAVSRMHAPPVGKTRWWFVAAGGVVSVLAGVFHGLAAYRY